MKKTRLLLVDDEPKILEGLQRLLRPLRREWDVVTAASARDALALLDSEPVDVMITDMRMPEMDGGALLALAKERSPGTVRIVLSGQTDKSAVLRSLPLAHQFLSKPCQPAELLEVLARVRHALVALADERVAATIGGRVGSLPSPIGLWNELTALLSNEEVDISAVGATIESDPALAAKVLQLANSPLFGLRRRVSNIAEAVSYLGIALVQSLVLVLGVAEALPVRAARFDAEAFQQHSLRVGHLARLAAPRPENADDCFAAGLLHDIGKLILASAMPQRYDALAEAALASGRTFDEEEAIADDCAPHPRMGAYLLNVWGLPWSVVEAVTNHDIAPTVDVATLGIAGSVYLAHQLIGEDDGEPGRVDREFVDRLGVGRRVEEWRCHALRMKAS